MTSTTQAKNVRVGVGVLVKDPKVKGRFFAGIRKGSHGAGTLSLPGGHLEMMESWEECARREVEEETGLEISDINQIYVTNDPMPLEDKHYVTIFMSAKCTSPLAEPENLEPDKCNGWESYSWSDLQAILAGERDDLFLFGPLKHLVEQSPESVFHFMNTE